MPRNICLAFGRFGSLFLLTSSVSADELFILSGCCSSSSLAIPMASTGHGYHISNWLAGLPKPVGVFACNDVRALQVSQACRIKEFAVPDAIAILGVDNDEVITQLSQP